MIMESARLSDLTCTACKARKVRCNRTLPRCDRCESRGLECCYPKRLKRKDVPKTPGKPREDSSVLSSILERLQHLEEQNTANDLSGLPETTALIPSGTCATPSSHLDSDLSFNATPPVTSRVDPFRVFEDALQQMENFKLQFYSKQVIMGNIDLPTELAKKLIHNYFARNSNDLFRSLVNRRLLEMIPDIIDLPHVHLDPVILVLYFSILYMECVCNSTNSPTNQVSGYATSCYLACLRALPYWRKEVHGSGMDFIASLFMAQVAILCSDYDLAWQMHRDACDFARALNLHNIDGGDYAGFQDKARSDEDRKGFWQLIQVDLTVRLVLDKPPLITADTWNVNLPWLNSSQPPPVDIHATAFITHSQITLILMHFFALLDTKADELQNCTKNLCDEIRNLLLEWQAGDWLLEPSADQVDEFIKVDVVITGYTYIIFMHRKVGLIRSNLTIPPADTPQLQLPMVLEASRRVIEFSVDLINMFPYPEGLSMVLVYYRIDIPIALLYCHVLYVADTHERTADVQRLQNLSQCICSVTHGCRELAPIGRAMQTLNRAVKDIGAVP